MHFSSDFHLVSHFKMLVAWLLLCFLHTGLCESSIFFTSNNTDITPANNTFPSPKQDCSQTLEVWIKFSDQDMGTTLYRGDLLSISCCIHSNVSCGVVHDIALRLFGGLLVCIPPQCYTLLPTSVLTSNRWYHVAITRGAVITIYMDGKVWLSVDSSPSWAAAHSKPSPTLILTLRSPLKILPTKEYPVQYYPLITVELAEIRYNLTPR